MAEPVLSDREQKFQKITAEDINNAYHHGLITAKDRNDLLREKAHVGLKTALDRDGYLKTMLERSIAHLQQGWDNMKEAIVRDPTSSVKDEAYYAGLAVWGQIQMVTAPVSAFGEVNGQVAENLALRAGASPGLARAINVATDVGSQFIPVGKMAGSFAKTVQKVGKKVAQIGSKAGPAAGEVASAASTLAPKTDDLAKAANALEEGMKADGLQFHENPWMKAFLGESGAPALKSIEAKAAEKALAGGAPEPVKTVAQQFLDDLAIFRTKMQRITKVQAHEETAAMAEKLGLSLDDLRSVVPGQALNEKEMYAYLKALEPQVTTLRDLAQNTLASGGSQESLDALARHASELFTVAPVFRGAEVTAGRSVEILKETPPMKQLTDMLMSWDPDAMAKGDLNGALKTFAEDIAAITEPEKLTGLTVRAQSGFSRLSEHYWPMFREAYINLLLSRPLTHVRNAIGNSIAATNAIGDRLAGGLFSIDKKGGLMGGESTYLVKGMYHSLSDAGKAWADAFKTVDPSDVSRLDYIPNKIPGVLGRIINAPGSEVRGMDNFFKTILRRGSYYAQAYREGAQSGRAGQELADFIARRVSHPTQTMMAEAEDFALVNTFQNDLGKIGEAMRGLQTGPLALWFPFMKTPINLAKYAWNRTPGLQLISKSLYQDILQGGTKADMAIGRLTMSNLQAMLLFNLAQEGLLTGSGPVDPGLRGSWMATHQPYSIKTKDGWAPISNMEPGNTILGMVADYAQVMNQLDDPTAEQGAMAIAFAISKNLADKTYWQTVNQLVDLTSSISKGEEVGTQASKIVTSPLTTVVTGGPTVAAVAKAHDPILRETRTFMDGILARVPGYSQTLPAKRDGYGDPILPPQTIGGPWLSLVSPFSHKDASTDRLKIEGDKLHVRLPTFPWNIGGAAPDAFDIREPQPGERYGVALEPKQRERWQQIYKNIIRHPKMGLEARLLNNQMYQDQTPAMKRETFESFLRDAKSTALDALTVEDPKIGKRLLEQEAATTRPFLQLNQQQQLDKQLQEGLGLFDRLSQQERNNLLRWGIYDPESETATEAAP